MRIEAAGPRRRTVSLTPLIDVVFILLVFFMLVSSFVEWRAIRLDGLVRTQTGASMRDALVVGVHQDGRFAVNGHFVSLPELSEQVARWVERHPDQQMLVQPVGNPSVQAIVAMLDRLRRLGSGNIGLVQE